MTEGARKIEEMALKLSADEREQMANRLFESVNKKELNEIDEAWMVVAEDRWEAYGSDPSEGVSKKDFFKDIKDSLGWK